MKIKFVILYHDGSLCREKIINVNPTTTGEYDDVRALTELKVGDIIDCEIHEPAYGNVTAIYPCRIKKKWVSEFSDIVEVEYTDVVEYVLEFYPTVTSNV